MPLTVTDVEPHDISEEGGYLLRIAGTFELGIPYEVRVDTVAGDYCLSGKPGRMRTVYALTVQELRCYSPVVARGDHDVVVLRADGSESTTLAAAFTVHARQFTTATHALRKVLPPFYQVGPRSIRQEPTIPSDSGWLQGAVDTASDEDGRIGGLRQTRLTAAVAAEEALYHPFEWDGTDTVLAGDTSEVTVGDWIRLMSGGRSYEILSEVPNVSVTLDLRGETPPTGPVSTALGGTVTWNGTTTVAMTDPEQVCLGMWIRQSLTGFWFLVNSVGVASVRVSNPHGVTIPTGSGGYKSPEPRTSIVSLVLAVESTLGWEDAGELALDGILYSYASRSLEPPELRGISREENGVQTFGLRKTHNGMSVVTDLTRASSGIDLAKRSILVDYAEGEWLNALGRNLGVLRYPFLESDDIFREIIKALAYCPRGTMYCLELALDAMVGAGNYELWEDLVSHPCTVFIRLLAGVASGNRHVGKTYLTGVEHRLSTSTTSVDVAGTVVTRGVVHGIRLRPEDRLSDFRDQLPSADTQIEYDGGSLTAVWVYAGLTEAWVTQVPGECITIDHSATGLEAMYQRVGRITPEADAQLQTLVRFDSVGSFESSTAWYNQCVGRINDGAFVIQWGIIDVDASHVALALSYPTFFGTQVILEKDRWYDVEIQKHGTDHVDLLVDGVLKDRRPYSSFSGATANRGFLFGVAVTGHAGEVVSFKQVGFHAETYDDYWSKRGAMTTDAGSPTRVTAAALTFVAGDVGKQIAVRGGSTTASGGLPDGTYVVGAFVGTSAVDVVGKTVPGTGSLVNDTPHRFEIPRTGPQLVFPDDLGKTIVVSGSDQGNDGSYTIDDLLDPDTGVSMSSWATWLRTETNVAEVTAPGSVVTESGLDWRVDPVFETDTGMEYELSAAGTASSSTLTLRQTLPYSPVVVDVTYSRVLSALVLLNFLIQNEIVQTLPTVLWSYYPFYLSDPFGFLRAYLDDLTAAGVIPELVIL